MQPTPPDQPPHETPRLVPTLAPHRTPPPRDVMPRIERAGEIQYPACDSFESFALFQCDPTCRRLAPPIERAGEIYRGTVANTPTACKRSKRIAIRSGSGFDQLYVLLALLSDGYRVRRHMGADSADTNRNGHLSTFSSGIISNFAIRESNFPFPRPPTDTVAFDSPWHRILRQSTRASR